MLWLVGLVMFLSGFACGYVGRMRHKALSDVASETLARPGTAVLMHGDLEVSRRKIKAPTYELQRYHGRHRKDAYVYVGRNDRNEYVFQLVTD